MAKETLLNFIMKSKSIDYTVRKGVFLSCLT